MAFLVAILLGLLTAMVQNGQYALAAPTPYWERQVATVPAYVVDYAPVVWLQSTELYNPSDIGAHLVYTQPDVNFTTIQPPSSPLTLNNLDQLNAIGGSNIYLTSIQDVTTNPPYLYGVKPDSTGKTEGAISTTVIVNDHGNGNVDAFYFYFYAFNQYTVVLGQEIGDHVGDWEHNMIRFSNGIPQEVWYSQHGNGEAFTYECLEKHGQRPVTYSAKGSHANYAITGTHDHTIPDLNLPIGLVEDHCDNGTLWDPILSAYFYSYDVNSNTYSAYDADDPTNWLYFIGQWGDKQYPASDPRQKELFGIPATALYTNGPTGPEDKQLNRTEVCPDDGDVCIVSPVLRP